ncbi:MAG: cysteine hydrolase family protein [Trichormus sp.]
MHPQHTALLLIGFQNDYFAADGILHNVIEESSKATKVIENTVELLKCLIEIPVLIIATPIFFTPNYEELVEPVGILKTIKEVGAFQAGTKGSQMIDQLLPFHSRIIEVPGKRGFNAFINTNLDMILQEKEITHVVVAGAVTSVCIDSTGRSAHEKGYQVVVLSDCTSARTVFEQEFYHTHVFPLYADTINHTELVQRLTNAV